MKIKEILIFLFVISFSLLITSCNSDKFIPIKTITVIGEGNQEMINLGESLQMIAQIQPENSSNKAVIWSVEYSGRYSSREYYAEITDEGILTGLAIGTVTVKATAKDSSGVEGMKEIVVTQPDPLACTITIEATPTERGAVCFDNINWKDEVDIVVDSGTMIKLYAKPAVGNTFSGWYENNSLIGISNPLSIIVNESRTINANFCPPHSMDIQRLDIHEPSLADYSSADEHGMVLFAHSYNVLQFNGEEKVYEFDSGESLGNLPRDMYPIFKRHDNDEDAENKFGLNGAVVATHNLWGAVEDQDYGDYVDISDPSIEAVPVVGGNASTTFQVKTHENIEKIEFELIDEMLWTKEAYQASASAILTRKSVEIDRNSNPSDGKGIGGYWHWKINLKDYFPDTETYASIVVRAYENHDDICYQQWQWPIYIDTDNVNGSIY